MSHLIIANKNNRLSAFIIVLALILSLLPSATQSQTGRKQFSTNLIFEGKIHYGFLYSHHLELDIFNSHIPAFELSVQQLTFGKRRWERAYNYPLIGVILYYSPFGTKPGEPSLGRAFAVMPMINFPLYRYQNFMLGFRVGVGIGYLTNPFDRTENYKNLAIGSHFNAAVNLMAEAKYRLNYLLTLTGGISLQHFSNGSMKLPNYGINAFALNIGVAYRPFNENSNIDDRFFAPTKYFEVITRRSIEFNFGALVGYKNLDAIYGESYFVYHLFENTFIPLGNKNKVGLGLDLSYDPSPVKQLEYDSIYVDNAFRLLKPGINGAYQLVLSKVGFIFNVGVYLAQLDKSNGVVYEKLAIQYNFSRNFFATIVLKAHFAKADYIGWGLGYKFNVKYGKRTFKGQ